MLMEQNANQTKKQERFESLFVAYMVAAFEKNENLYFLVRLIFIILGIVMIPVDIICLFYALYSWIRRLLS